MILDATCAPADITLFPPNLKMLNDARVKGRSIIDDLHAPLKGNEKKRGPGYKCPPGFFTGSKQKRLSRKKRRKAIRK
ncbi:MAG: hypothetical protein R2860_03335 [Desulfobacterales bacterium]